jgi:type I restriction enzyme S subunit
MSISTSKALPAGWEWKKLGEISEIIMGQSPPGKSYTKEKNGVPLLNGAADFNSKEINPKQNTLEPTKLSIRGDIIFCIRATIGNITFADKEYCLGRGVCAIRINDKKVIPKYISYLLEGKIEKLASISEGSTIKGIRRDDIKKLTFIIPPLQIQEQIVSILQIAENTKGLRAQVDELTKRLLQSVFLEMFGDPVKNPNRWEISTLENVCSELYRYPTFYGFEYSKTGVPVVRINNICPDGMLDPNVSNYVFIEPKLNENFPRTILELNDIVMAVRGDGSTAKRIGLVNTMNLVGANISPNLIRFKTKREILSPLYLFNLMISDSGQRLLEKYVTRTAKKTITAKDIKKIPIPLPPLPLQQKFARVVEKVESMRQNQLQSYQQIDKLFNTLMQKAFNGELTACDSPPN